MLRYTDDLSSLDRFAPTNPAAPTATVTADPTQTADYLRWLFRPGDQFELRALGVHPRPELPHYYAVMRQTLDQCGQSRAALTGRYHYHEIDAAARDAAELSGHCKGVYVVLNPLVPIHFGYSTSSSRMRPGKATTDEMIQARRRVFIDIDPEKPTGQGDAGATDAERQHAHDLAQAVREFLESQNWPTPVVIDSGNGVQLVYPLAELPIAGHGQPDDPVKLSLVALGQQFTTPHAKVDPVVGNPARLGRLPGTQNAKGDPTPDRPHRLASIAGGLPPADQTPVTHSQLRELASHAKIDRPAAASTRETIAVPDAPPGARPRSTHHYADVERRAVAYLDKMPPSIQHDDGSGACMKAARAVCWGFDLGEDAGFRILRDHYSPRCAPPWSDAELKHKCADAVKQAGAPYPRGHFLERDRNDYRPGTHSPSTATAAPEATPAAATGDDTPGTLLDIQAATAEGRDRLKPSSFCRKPVHVIGKRQRTGMRCHVPLPCGRARDCPECRDANLFQHWQESESYLGRTSDPNDPDARRLFVTLLESPPGDTLLTRIRRAGGESHWTETADPAGTAAEFGLSEISLVLGEEGTRLISDIDRRAYVLLISLPASATPPPGCQAVTLAGALRGITHAYRTIPAAPPDAKRYQMVKRSHGWGDEVEKPTSDFRPEGAAVLPLAETREVIAALVPDAPPAPVVIDAERQPAPGVGWDLPGGKSLVLSLLLRGVHAPYPPTKARIIDLGREWLSAIPDSIGDGELVAAELRERLWRGPALDTTDRLLLADANDRTCEAIREAEENTRMEAMQCWLKGEPQDHIPEEHRYSPPQPKRRRRDRQAEAVVAV